MPPLREGTRRPWREWLCWSCWVSYLDKPFVDGHRRPQCRSVVESSARAVVFDSDDECIGVDHPEVDERAAGARHRLNPVGGAGKSGSHDGSGIGFVSARGDLGHKFRQRFAQHHFLEPVVTEQLWWKSPGPGRQIGI